MEEIRKHYQVGNIIKIRQEPKMAIRFGFTIDTEHVIQNPPKNRINSAISVWINDKNGVLRDIPFHCWIWTNKIDKIRRVRKV